MYARFGQELYAREMVRAAAIVAAGEGEGGLATRIAEGLTQPSAATRARIAGKLLQRLAAGASRPEQRGAFARLVASVPEREAQRELVYYAVASADRLVGAIAREVLHPYFIDGRMPRGVTETEFAVRNTGRLLMVEPLLTLPFLAWYAEKQWDFLSVRTVVLAMRILRQAEIVLPASLTGGPGRTPAVALAPHGMTRSAFAWCLYDEFASAPAPPTVDRVECATFTRTFVVPPSVIAARLRDAEKAGLIQVQTGGGGRRVLLPLTWSALVDRLADRESVGG